MPQLTQEEVKSYVKNNIGEFHNNRLASLKGLQLKSIIERKNPYLFKAKNMLTSDEIVKAFLDAHISSNEETIFGDWLEGLAIFINERVYAGRKSTTEGLDLEFDKDGVRYIVAIKSGPSWSNTKSLKKLDELFTKASQVARTGRSGLVVEAINGCCYGNDNRHRLHHQKLCGQAFWTFISGDSDLYKTIIEPLGYEAKERNEEFLTLYAQVTNVFIRQFSNDFCDTVGNILWDKIVEINSGIKPPKPPKKSAVKKSAAKKSAAKKNAAKKTAAKKTAARKRAR